MLNGAPAKERAANNKTCNRPKCRHSDWLTAAVEQEFP